MRIGISMYTDTIIRHLRNGFLDGFLKNCKNNDVRVYIPFGVRKEVEESLENPAETESLHHIMKEGFAQGVIVKSRHKYDLDRDFKILFRRLNGINRELNQVQRHIVALSLQLGIEIHTKNKQIIRTISEIKTTPHLQKYAARFLSKGKFRIH